MIGMETNRRGQVIDKQLARRLDRHVVFLEKELAEVDRDIGQAIKTSPVWRETEALLKSVPGIGDVTARTLLAELPELGTIGRQARHWRRVAARSRMQHARSATSGSAPQW